MYISRVTPLNFGANLVVNTSEKDKEGKNVKAEIDPDKVLTYKPLNYNKRPYEGLILECSDGMSYTLSKGDYLHLSAILNMKLIHARNSDENIKLKDIEGKELNYVFSVR